MFYGANLGRWGYQFTEKPEFENHKLQSLYTNCFCKLDIKDELIIMLLPLQLGRYACTYNIIQKPI